MDVCMKQDPDRDSQSFPQGFVRHWKKALSFIPPVIGNHKKDVELLLRDGLPVFFGLCSIRPSAQLLKAERAYGRRTLNRLPKDKRGFEGNTLLYGNYYFQKHLFSNRNPLPSAVHPGESMCPDPTFSHVIRIQLMV